MAGVAPPASRPDNNYTVQHLLLMLLSHQYPDGSMVSLPMVDGLLQYLGYEQLTGLGSSAALQAIPSNPSPTLVWVQAEGAHIRFLGAGAVPTSDVGMRIWQNSEKYLNLNPSGLRFIQESAGGVLNVMYFTVG